MMNWYRRIGKCLERQGKSILPHSRTASGRPARRQPAPPSMTSLGLSKPLAYSYPASPVLIGIFLFIIFFISTPAFAASDPLVRVLPSGACAEGWNMAEKAELYNKDTLFERINGESELYFPYGFELLAAARYENVKNPKQAVDVEVYKMGSLLDAFGMYANYRKRDSAPAAVGADGFISPSQLFFYQDRYFIKLQALGATELDKKIFLQCARAISRNLPQAKAQPKELASLRIPAVVQKTERYIPQSLMGYAFFRKGLVADAEVEGTPAKVFVVLEDSSSAARKALNDYQTYLKKSGQDVQIIEDKGSPSLTAVDPLYKDIYLVQQGATLIGVANAKNPFIAKQLADQIRQRIANSKK